MTAAPTAISFARPPFFRDHHVGGRPVLPAVEAMEGLAAHGQRGRPANHPQVLADIRFDKFLYLDSPEPPPVFACIAPGSDGPQATLTSRFQSKGTAITRSLVHASLTFRHEPRPAVDAPAETMACLTGIVTPVDPERIYRELVPFGPAYRNIRHLLISPDGALARVGSPNPPDPRPDLCLGSPYVLDAAFHAACVWCQRFGNTVAFPVAIKKRVIIRPTRPDESYTARIVPVHTDTAPFVFDIYILGHGGRVREVALGVQMRDVSGGRNTPPAGFWQPVAEDSLALLQSRTAGLVVVERGAVAEFAAAALSDSEKQRLAPMTPTRAAGYLSARLALKRLSRNLSGNTDPRHAREIETVAQDGRAPQCPLADGTIMHCSVAHDRRFTVAVAADRPVGVDVEPLSDKALGAPDLFMDPEEQALIDRCRPDRAEAALRTWSAKEAAAKATGRDLADTWQNIRLTDVTRGETRLSMDTGSKLTARHAEMEGHLVTLLQMERQP